MGGEVGWFIVLLLPVESSFVLLVNCFIVNLLNKVLDVYALLCVSS